MRGFGDLQQRAYVCRQCHVRGGKYLRDRSDHVSGFFDVRINGDVWRLANLCGRNYLWVRLANMRGSSHVRHGANMSGSSNMRQCPYMRWVADMCAVFHVRRLAHMSRTAVRYTVRTEALPRQSA